MATAQMALLYPEGFARAGGADLPLKLRSEALEECIEETRGVEDRARKWAITCRIVRKKWEAVAPAGTDVTNFSFGAASVPAYQDPNAGDRARRMLAWVPTTTEFVGCLDPEQAQVWEMSFSPEDHTQKEIAERLGKSQGTVSKILDKAVRRLNEKYRALREADQLPFAIAAWVKAYVGDDSSAADLYSVVELLRQRALARERMRPPVSTGCKSMDSLSIRGD
jgi:sigma-70-like protein